MKIDTAQAFKCYDKEHNIFGTKSYHTAKGTRHTWQKETVNDTFVGHETLCQCHEQ